MNLVREHWQKKEIAGFQGYLKTFARPEKMNWAKIIKLKKDGVILYQKV